MEDGGGGGAGFIGPVYNDKEHASKPLSFASFVQPIRSC